MWASPDTTTTYGICRGMDSRLRGNDDKNERRSGLLILVEGDEGSPAALGSKPKKAKLCSMWSGIGATTRMVPCADGQQDGAGV